MFLHIDMRCDKCGDIFERMVRRGTENREHLCYCPDKAPCTRIPAGSAIKGNFASPSKTAPTRRVDHED